MSGSLVLYLAIRQGTWQPNDVDVYVNHDSYSAFIEDFVSTMNAVEIPAQEKQRADDEDTLYSPAIQNIRHFKTEWATYDIIQSITVASLPLQCFHSTVVVNALTHDCLFVSSPLYTLNMCGIRGCVRRQDAPTRRAYEKYESRGFQYVTRLPEASRAKAGGPMFIPLDRTKAFHSSDHELRHVFPLGWEWATFHRGREALYCDCRECTSLNWESPASITRRNSV